MCGRFTQKSERPDIQLEFYIQGWYAEPEPSYNIAPSQKPGIVYIDNNNIVFNCLQWGLIPNWARDMKTGFSMINAKAETITQKPSFKNSFKSKRCLVPAEGYFEWKKDGKTKIPYYIFPKDKPLISFAAIYDEWVSPENELIKTFSIITTDANELVAGIYDKKRMPVIIDHDHRDLWLDNNEYPEKDLLALLKPYDSGLMDAYPVSAFVNTPKNNSEKCIEPVND